MPIFPFTCFLESMRRFYLFIAFPFLGADQGQRDGLGGRGGLLQVMTGNFDTLMLRFYMFQ